MVATPVGHAVAMTLNARAADGRQGVWAGALEVTPYDLIESDGEDEQDSPQKRFRITAEGGSLHLLIGSGPSSWQRPVVNVSMAPFEPA